MWVSLLDIISHKLQLADCPSPQTVAAVSDIPATVRCIINFRGVLSEIPSALSLRGGFGTADEIHTRIAPFIKTIVLFADPRLKTRRGLISVNIRPLTAAGASAAVFARLTGAAAARGPAALAAGQAQSRRSPGRPVQDQIPSPAADEHHPPRQTSAPAQDAQ